MSIFTPDEYKKEAIREGNLSDKYMKKVKIPTSMRTIYVWCRNCNCKNSTTRSSVIFLGRSVELSLAAVR